MIRLFTSLYPELNPKRKAEIEESLRQNAKRGVIDQICLLLEDRAVNPFQTQCVKVKSIDHRPKYEDFLYWAKILEPRLFDLTIIANSDIYFDESIAVLANTLKPNQCAALSRWDVNTNGEPVVFDRNDSQDAWVFRGPLKKINGDFCVGVPRCDNRVLYELKRAGYEVINPSFSIRAYHLHDGVRGEYQNENLEHFVEPPYAYLWPHNLWSLPQTLIHNLRHPDARVDWRFDRRKFLNSLPVRAVRKVARGFGSSLAKTDR